MLDQNCGRVRPRGHGRPKSAPRKPRQPRKRRQTMPRLRCSSIRLRASSRADGVSWRYVYAACFTSGCRIMCTSPATTAPPAGASSGECALAAAAAYSGDDMMSRRLVYPRPPPPVASRALVGISISGGAHRPRIPPPDPEARFAGRRCANSTKSPPLPVLPAAPASGDRSLCRWRCRSGDSTTAVTIGIGPEARVRGGASTWWGREDLLLEKKGERVPSTHEWRIYE